LLLEIQFLQSLCILHMRGAYRFNSRQTRLVHFAANSCGTDFSKITKIIRKYHLKMGLERFSRKGTSLTLNFFSFKFLYKQYMWNLFK